MITAEQAGNVAKMFLQILDSETQITRKVLAAVPGDKLDFKLGAKGRTTRELMWHLITSELFFTDGIANGEFSMAAEPSAPATKDEMLAWYDSHIPAGLAKCKTLAPEHLAKTISFFNVMNLPAAMYFSMWNSHTIHHRGQLSTYLRAMNAHVPDIYGGSADEPFQMPASA